MLAYFLQRSKVMLSPSSLWCEYSMLKATIYLNDNIDISKYQKLKTFLKRKNVGYRPKKSLVFTREDIIKFLSEAPDDIYLMKKVAAIMGIAGACRTDELCRMTVDNIEDKGSVILVNIPDSRNQLQRSFTFVNNEKENFHCIDLFRKYYSLRPKDIDIRRFFLKYQNGRCFKQVVGKNSFTKIPFEMAKFLKLENPQAYTGHSFRKTSTTLLANTGIDILGLNRHGGWKSSAIAERCVAELLVNTAEGANRILYNQNIQEAVAGPFSTQATTDNIHVEGIQQETDKKIITEDIQEDITSDLHIDAASEATLNLLPVKSRQTYDAAYNRFKEWCKDKNTTIYTENVLLAYFTEKAKDFKSSTLWSQYSMVKACLIVNDNVDISKYSKLIAFLKSNADGYRAEKSKIFTRQQIEKFLLEANNDQYLMIKVALILGTAGGCRREELINLVIDNIEDLGSALIVKIPDSKTKRQRTFIVTDNEGSLLNMLDIYRKYVALRPPHTNHRRFFINYKSGKCSTQVVGKNTIGKIPKQIAMYLELPNPSLYTGNCLRRTAAT